MQCKSIAYKQTKNINKYNHTKHNETSYYLFDSYWHTEEKETDQKKTFTEE